MKLYLVGIVKIVDNEGTGRLLLYKICKNKKEAINYQDNHIKMYYKDKPYLNNMEIKEVTIEENK